MYLRFPGIFSSAALITKRKVWGKPRRSMIFSLYIIFLNSVFVKACFPVLYNIVKQTKTSFVLGAAGDVAKRGYRNSSRGFQILYYCLFFYCKYLKIVIKIFFPVWIKIFYLWVISRTKLLFSGRIWIHDADPRIRIRINYGSETPLIRNKTLL